ncbi:MAG: histidinol phosphatase [Thermodesulfobacteriota bacterium]
MTPRAIVRTALERGVEMIAVCDHNSARNTAVTRRLGQACGLAVIPGIEVTTAEEVHILGLFASDEAAARMQEEVYAHLYGQNDEKTFGYQVVIDEEDMVEDLDERLLIGATTLGIGRVVDAIHELSGLAIASHVDRSGFGVFSQLGFIPPGLKLDALEISRHTDEETARKRYPQCNEYPLVRSSDAHYLKDIGAVVTHAKLAAPRFEELKMALSETGGRAVIESPEGLGRSTPDPA